MTTYHIYIDRLADTSEPCYVGKGNDARVKNFDRNRLHQRAQRDHGIVREVVLVTSIEQLALDHEVELIAEFHTFVDDPFYNGVGCNLTPGGEGHTPSQATRKLYSQRMTKLWSDSAFRARAVNNMKGVNGKHSRTAAQRASQSAAVTGPNNPNYGKPVPRARIDKMRATKAGRPSKLKGRSAAPEAVAKKMKGLTVVDPEGGTRAFSSRKAAAHAVATELGLSPHTLLCYFVSREPTFHGYTFTYPQDDTQ